MNTYRKALLLLRRFTDEHDDCLALMSNHDRGRDVWDVVDVSHPELYQRCTGTWLKGRSACPLRAVMLAGRRLRVEQRLRYILRERR